MWDKVGECSYICVVSQMLRHILLLFLTGCILLGSVGVALGEQLCLMTGLKEVGTEKPMDSCCEKPDAPVSEEDGCCTFELSFEKLEPVSSIKVFNLEAPVFFAAAFQPLFTTWAPAIAADQRILTYSDSSPPLYGILLLHRLQILIV